MADGSERISSNVRAGAFIVITVILGVTVFVILSGWNPFEKRTPYQVSFSVQRAWTVSRRAVT